MQLSNNVPEKYYASYILGIFDGDGCIGFYNNKLLFRIASSLKACQQIQQFLIYNCNVNKTKISNNGKSKVNYNITYCGNVNVDKIMQVLYANASIFLKRKRTKHDQYLKHKKRRDIL